MTSEITPDKRRVAAAAAAYVHKTPFVDVMRDKADKYALFGLLESSRFLADKASSASGSAADDALRLARVHYAAQQYRRALHVLTAADLTASSLPARLLAAQCSFEMGDLDECLACLGETDTEPPRGLAISENEPPLHRRRPAVSPTGPSVNGRQGSGAANAASAASSPTVPPITSAAADTAEIRSALCVLRGRVFEELENSDRAAWWYKRALVWDVYCSEAFTRLEDAGLISPEEATQFSNDLLVGRGANTALWNTAPASDTTPASTPPASPSGNRMSIRRSGVAKQLAIAPETPSAQSPASAQKQQVVPAHQSEAHSWVCAFYKIRVDRSGPLPAAPAPGDMRATRAVPLTENALPLDTSILRSAPVVTGAATAATRTAADVVTSDRRMSDNIDVLAVRAMRLFHALDFEECARLTRVILDRDPFIEERFTLIHLAALAELDERHELFVTAHTLVDNSPREAISWMAVGYYYFACGKFELARRYLQKATGMSPRLGPAWIAFGHAFAAQDESDQAMAAYRTAARLYPGSLMPPLFMGMEYARQSSLVHATSFFHSSREACPSDPAPRHELGVIAYRSGDLKGAVAYFKAALSLWEASYAQKEYVSHGGRRADAMEATLFNLGHCYRRLHEFGLAKDCYEKSLGLRPRSASTCSALGMVKHALGDPAAAVAMYHRALRYNPEDALSVLMLNRALEDMQPV